MNKYTYIYNTVYRYTSVLQACAQKLVCLLPSFLDSCFAFFCACLLLCLLASFLNSFRACLLARLLACLLPSFLAFFVSCLLACFLPSLLPFMLAYFFACLLACFLPSFLTCLLTSLLACSLACFLPCLLTSLLACLLAWDRRGPKKNKKKNGKISEKYRHLCWAGAKESREGEELVNIVLPSFSSQPPSGSPAFRVVLTATGAPRRRPRTCY